MADPPTDADTGDDARVGTPRWVKVFGTIAVVVVVLLFVISLLIGGGEHGPGRHAPPSGVQTTARDSHDPDTRHP